MYLLIIWRSICHKPVLSILSAAIIAASTAIALFVVMLSSGGQNALVRAAEPFPIVVGAKGSPNQLVLNTVFLQDAPIGNISHEELDKLAKNPAVEMAIPLGFGDNYRGYRLVGTDKQLFEYKLKPNSPNWLQLASGRKFSGAREAVIGSKVAKEGGLAIGDTFKTSHGLVHGTASNRHEESFTVVGILAPLAGPYDSAVLVAISDMWEMHQPGHEHQHFDAEVAEPEAEHELTGGITAILVKPKGYSEALGLYNQYKNMSDSQLIFPAQTIIQLFAMLGEGEKILQIISGAVVLLAILAAALALYWSAMQSVRERAVLRAIGAARRDIIVLIAGEGIILLGISIAIGSALASSSMVLISQYLAQKTALSISITWGAVESIIIAAIFIVGLVFSILPAVFIAKADIAKEL